MEKHEEYFNAASARFRFTGAGGTQVPNPDLTRNPQDPPKVDPGRQVILKGDWVVVGGRNVKTRNSKSSHVNILNVSAKILDAERKEREAKKDKPSN